MLYQLSYLGVQRRRDLLVGGRLYNKPVRPCPAFPLGFFRATVPALIVRLFTNRRAGVDIARQGSQRSSSDSSPITGTASILPDKALSVHRPARRPSLCRPRPPGWRSGQTAIGADPHPHSGWSRTAGPPDRSAGRRSGTCFLVSSACSRWQASWAAFRVGAHDLFSLAGFIGGVLRWCSWLVLVGGLHGPRFALVLMACSRWRASWAAFRVGAHDLFSLAGLMGRVPRWCSCRIEPHEADGKSLPVEQ
jgi:hypothetical protein